MTHKPAFLSGAPGDSAGVREEAGPTRQVGLPQLSPGPSPPAGLGLQLLPWRTHEGLRSEACSSHCSVLWVLLRCGVGSGGPSGSQEYTP